MWTRQNIPQLELVCKRSLPAPYLNSQFAPVPHLVLGDPVPVEELKLEADVLDAVGPAPLAPLAGPLEVLRQVEDERLVEDRVQRLLLHVRLLLRARALFVAQHVDLDVGICEEKGEVARLRGIP